MFRAVYVMPQESELPLVRDLMSLYNGTLDSNHPFCEVANQKGEVAAWGGIHWTLCDALTCVDPDAFNRVVRRFGAMFDELEIHPKELKILGKTSLVIGCDGPNVESLRAALIQATRPLIDRSRITDEEIQRAHWRIEQFDGPTKEHLRSFEQAFVFYRESGSPVLPTSRHFRLNFFIRLFKEWQRAKDEDRIRAEARLRYFLSLGEPPWYAGPGGLHLTIVSGLHEARDLSYYSSKLWPIVKLAFRSYQPTRLAIMVEDADSPVTVKFFDWLTETWVQETRPGFTVGEWITLGCCEAPQEPRCKI